MGYGVEVYRINTSGFSDVGEMDKQTFSKRKNDSEFVTLDDYLLENLSF
jgi:hypothetical protein